MVRRVKAVIIGSHPSLYNKMEELRKMYKEQAGINLSQMDLTNIISKQVKVPMKINMFGGCNVKKKKRRSY